MATSESCLGGDAGPVRTGTCNLCGYAIYEGTEHGPVCQFRFQPNLRDQFAMAALTGVWSDPIAMESVRLIGDARAFCPTIAKWCYSMADAMLKQRENVSRET